MTAEELARKYIDAMENALKNVQRVKGAVLVGEECIEEIYSYVSAYLKDAKYFMDQRKFETSLTSIAYCEGLLDALKLMGAVKTPTGRTQP
jgi:hypothetical protein